MPLLASSRRQLQPELCDGGASLGTLFEVSSGTESTKIIAPRRLVQEDEGEGRKVRGSDSAVRSHCGLLRSCRRCQRDEHAAAKPPEAGLSFDLIL